LITNQSPPTILQVAITLVFGPMSSTGTRSVSDGMIRVSSTASALEWGWGWGKGASGGGWPLRSVDARNTRDPSSADEEASMRALQTLCIGARLCLHSRCRGWAGGTKCWDVVDLIRGGPYLVVGGVLRPWVRIFQFFTCSVLLMCIWTRASGYAIFLTLAVAQLLLQLQVIRSSSSISFWFDFITSSFSIHRAFPSRFSST
jgi:hypothetical protein